MAIKDRYWTISEAAKQFKVTRQTISRWIAEGKIPTEKVGREILIKKKDLSEFYRKRLYESAADSIIDLYLATAEEYCREKGYINENTPTAHAEFFDENDKTGILYKLTNEDKTEVDNRVRPILMGFLKDLRKSITKEIPQEISKKASKQRRKTTK